MLARAAGWVSVALVFYEMKTKPKSATNLIACAGLGFIVLMAVGYVEAAVAILVSSLLVARFVFLPNR